MGQLASTYFGLQFEIGQVSYSLRVFVDRVGILSVLGGYRCLFKEPEGEVNGLEIWRGRARARLAETLDWQMIRLNSSFIEVSVQKIVGECSRDVM